MNRRRNIISLIVLALLLIALPLLGFMQFRWLDAASENDAQMLQRNISTAVRQIRSEIGFEFASIATLFAPDAGGADTASLYEQVADDFAAYYETWIEGSRFPNLVKSVYLVDLASESAELFIFQPEGQTFVPAEGTPPQSVSMFLEQEGWTPRDRLTADPLVLAIPVGRLESSDGERNNHNQFDFRNLGFVVVEIDKKYLAEVVAPLLADTYLGTQDGEFAIAVADNDANEVLFSTAAESGRELSYEELIASQRDIDSIVSLNAWSALTVAVIESSGRIDLQGIVGEFNPRVQAPVVQQWLSFRSRTEPEWTLGGPVVVPPPEGRPVMFEPEQMRGLNLYVWHSSGSIRAASTRSRNRNLLASYLVLGGLAAAAVVFYLLFRRANRLRDREHEFVATVTHELRTPISAMTAVADNLADGIIREPDRVREYGRTLMDEGRRLRSLIDQVLLYAGLSGNRHNQKWSPTDVEKIVTDVASRVPDLHRDRLITRVAPDLPTYRGDPVAIETVISNLLSNAGKHNDGTATVTLHVYGEPRRGKYNLVIHVSDKGRGIPRRELGRVREPFFRGSHSQANQVPGTGLGLSLIQRIVDTYGGSLSIDSVVGRGTTVTVRLPFERGEERET